MEPTTAVAHVAAGLDVPCGPRLARVAIPTPRATQGELALEENVEGRIPRAERCRKQPELLMHGKRLEVALQQGFQAFAWHSRPRALWGLSFVSCVQASSLVLMPLLSISDVYLCLF